MNRLILVTTIAMSILAGCTGAAPTAAPSQPPAVATPTPTPSPSPAPTETDAPSDAARPFLTTASLEPGRYFVEVGGYRFTFTVADPGWRSDASYGAVFQGEDAVGAIFWAGGQVNSLYSDPCDSYGTDFEPGPSVEELADALASLEGFEATAPTDVTVSGYSGKRVAITVPTDVDVRDPACFDAKYSLNRERWYQTSGQTDDMLILDLDGERQTITASTTTGTSSEVSAQLDRMVESVVIEPI